MHAPAVYKSTADMCHTRVLSIQLRAYSFTLVLPRTRTEFAKRAFAVAAAPVIWNSLPAALRHCQTVLSFKKHLKTHYFNG